MTPTDHKAPNEGLIAIWIHESMTKTVGAVAQGRYIIGKYQEWAALQQKAEPVVVLSLKDAQMLALNIDAQIIAGSGHVHMNQLASSNDALSRAILKAKQSASQPLPHTPEPLTDGVIVPLEMVKKWALEVYELPPHWAERRDGEIMQQLQKFADLVSGWAHALGGKQGMADTERKYAAVMELAGKDVLFFAEGGKPCLLCSDTFSYASADAEPVMLDEAEYVLELYRQFNYDGPMAWCSMKRNWLPVLPQLDTDRFKQACGAIKARIQEIGQQPIAAVPGAGNPE